MSTTENGLLFPVTDDDGDRSSSITGKAILTAALKAANPAAAQAVRRETDWRYNYPKHIRTLVETSAYTADAAQRIAADGLDALHHQFEFMRDGRSRPLHEAMARPQKDTLHTAEVVGRIDAEPPVGLSIPYQGEQIRGDRLLRQIGKWEHEGIIEPSHGAALRRVHEHPEWLDLRGQQFVLLGAGAEMGPIRQLLRWQATVIAVDLDRAELWQRLIGLAQQHGGRLRIPVRRPVPADISVEALPAVAGVDLLTETPEIAAWLAQMDGPMTVGGYAYLDGRLHVRVSLAMDAIMQRLTAVRDDISLAFLATPTDVFAIPADAAQMARDRFFEERKLSKLWQEPLRALSNHRFFEPNIDEVFTTAASRKLGITDCLVIQQGPNYALAKRLQQWRAIAARTAGVHVSGNVAPATTTHSVVKNLALAAAYSGANHFGVEIFEPETSNAVMAALLVNDLRYENAAAHPANKLENPLDLFMEGANHGGLWRAAFQARSVMEIAALLGWRAARR